MFKFLSKLFKTTHTMIPVGMVSYSWSLDNGTQIYCSTVFYMSEDDSYRSIVNRGTPPKGYIEEDHLFYHKIVVPFLSYMSVDENIKFDTKENTIVSLDILSGKSKSMMMFKDISTGDISSPITSTEDNIIHVDFNNPL